MDAESDKERLDRIKSIRKTAYKEERKQMNKMLEF